MLLSGGATEGPLLTDSRPSSSDCPYALFASSTTKLLTPASDIQAAAAAPWAVSEGMTRPKLRDPLGCDSLGIWLLPGADRFRSTADAPAETCSIPASLVIGSDVRVVPESSSPT